MPININCIFYTFSQSTEMSRWWYGGIMVFRDIHMQWLTELSTDDLRWHEHGMKISLADESVMLLQAQHLHHYVTFSALTHKCT